MWFGVEFWLDAGRTCRELVMPLALGSFTFKWRWVSGVIAATVGAGTVGRPEVCLNLWHTVGGSSRTPKYAQHPVATR